YHDWRDRRLKAGFGSASAAPTLDAGHGSLTEHQSKLLASRWNIPITQEKAVIGVDAAVDAASSIGYPVALKADSASIQHKTEAGVVRLSLTDADQVRQAYQEVTAISGEPHVLVQEMVRDAIEVITGISYDPQFGPMLLFGSGGVTVEVFHD